MTIRDFNRRATEAPAGSRRGAVAFPRDRVVLRTATTDSRLRFYIYWPSTAPADAPILVAVHGISRNAREHVQLLSSCASLHGVLVMAPVFHPDIFPHYQRLGRKGVGLRSDQALNRMLEDFGKLVGRRIDRFHMFGYSGGGQFAHRYALAYPTRINALAINSPGWYTWPDAMRRFPHGLAPSAHLPDLHFDFDRFLQIPISVWVGAHDTERDPQLRTGQRLDRRQGLNRLERGRRWIRRLKREARSRGLTPRLRFRELPNSGHSFRDNVLEDRIDRRIFKFLFGAPPGTDAPS